MKVFDEISIEEDGEADVRLEYNPHHKWFTLVVNDEGDTLNLIMNEKQVEKLVSDGQNSLQESDIQQKEEAPDLREVS